MANKVILLTSGTTWTVPADFSSTNFIVCIGPGANGVGGIDVDGNGGAGGAYSIKNNAANLNPSDVVAIQIGAANSGTATLLKDDTSTTICSAAAGSGTTGGAAASGIGDTKHSGGNGGLGATEVIGCCPPTPVYIGGGGGGAGGSAGNGTAGSAGNLCLFQGGHGGASGGTSGGAGGAGGLGASGSGGSAGTDYALTAGGNAGPGGGGGGAGNQQAGGGGGAYGAGGGGGGGISVGGGAGQQGCIVISYLPVSASLLTTSDVNYDFPNPRGYPRSLNLLGNGEQPNAVVNTLLNVVYKKPFNESDWPLPNRGAYHNTSITNFYNAVETQLIGQDRFFGANGQVPPQLDWPVPRGPQYPSDLRTFVRSLTEFFSSQQLYYAPGMGVPQLDWPVPKGYVPVIDLKTWAMNNTIPMFTLENQLLGFKYPLPIYDWPVPKGYVPAISLRTLGINNTINIIEQNYTGNYNNTDFPNPRGYPFPMDLRTIAGHVNLQLLEQQTFFYGNRGPEYDYPNPRGYSQPNTNYNINNRAILFFRKPYSFSLVMG